MSQKTTVTLEVDLGDPGSIVAAIERLVTGSFCDELSLHQELRELAEGWQIRLEELEEESEEESDDEADE